MLIFRNWPAFSTIEEFLVDVYAKGKTVLSDHAIP